MIVIRNLSKSYSVHKKEAGLLASVQSLFVRRRIYRRALHNIHMSVNEGEILGLVGANGAGKTTLVKILAGIIHPDEGQVNVLGHTPWLRRNSFRRQISLIMGQKAQLWWDLPAADCFILLREIYGLDRREFQHSLDYLTEQLDVRDQLHIQIRRLSLGERMKMELIAALLHKPRVVYLDEPTIGLDLSAQRAIRNFLLEYRQHHKPAMILTSHYMEDIERLCERIVILRRGEIVYDGPLKRIVSDFARHKIMSAVLNHAEVNSIHLPARLGSVIQQESGFIKLMVERDRVAEAAAFLLKNLPVIDLNIEEEEIGNIIEAIQTADQQA